MTIRLRWRHIHDDTDKGETVVSLPMTIGRSEECDLPIGDKMMGVSRFHGHMIEVNGLPVLYDCGSTNGIFVNRIRVHQFPVSDGLIFLMGQYRFDVEVLVQCQKETCQKMVSSREKTCPWCGQFMADAVTTFAPVGIGDW